MKNIFKYIKLLLIMIVIGAFGWSCSESMNDYEQYIRDQKETTYAGKLDSMVVWPGDGRVMVSGLLKGDPNITKVKIFWNNGKDSIEIPVERSAGVDTVEAVITGLSEGVMSFEAYTYDSFGNVSVPVNVVGKVYGDRYRESLLNRAVSSDDYLAPSFDNALVKWFEEDANSGLVGVELSYINVEGEMVEKFVPGDVDEVELENVKSAGAYSYRSLFVPDTLAIDTFYTEIETKRLPILKNIKRPFATLESSGRWGTLAGWMTNDAIKVHGGYGGWDERNWDNNSRHSFNVESGWGTAAIKNGKIYQTVVLDPGTYTFAITDLLDTNLTEEDQAYLVVGEGGALPDVEGIGNALGAAHIFKGKPIEELKVEFSLSQETEVSIGYLTTQSGDTPGRYCVIRAFDFTQH